jgi:hypothetical protein
MIVCWILLMPNIDFNRSIKPIAYKNAARHRAMTKARMIVFFYSALLMREISWSAPGIDFVSITPRILLVFFSLLV